MFLFLSTLSLRRATSKKYLVILGCVISIHALLAESDLDYKGICVQNLEFLSTLSLRRATTFSAEIAKRGEEISIHALLAESDACPSDVPVMSLTISIHALLAESDP